MRNESSKSSSTAKSENTNFQSKSKKRKFSKNKGNNYSKGKGGQNFSENEKSRQNSVSDYVGSTNDPRWYNKNARLIADASKIPFGLQLGAQVDLRGEAMGHDGLVKPEESYAVPGIMSLCMINTPGIANTPSDGVNLAAAGLFQFIRKNLSTTATYSAADVMMYVLGLDDIFSMYANIARLFGIVNAYSAINLYMPRHLCAAGYDMDEDDFNDFVSQLNVYRSQFNNLIYKASSLYLPTDFSITNRHAWLYSNYFIDGNSSKSQIYIHRMLGRRYLDETTYVTGTALKYEENASDVSGLLQQFDSMIEKYRTSDSMLRIAADMRRAFEGRSQWKLAYIDEGFMVLPTVDMNVLSQIHNTTVLSSRMYYTLSRWIDSPESGGHNANLDITQDVNKNTVHFSPIYRIDEDDWKTSDMIRRAFCSCICATGNRILNFHKPDVSSDDIVEATRDTIIMRYVAAPDEYQFRFYNTGADICFYAVMYTLEDNIDLVPHTFNLWNEIQGEFLSRFSTFDWAPLIYIGVLPDELTESPKTAYLMGDLENYSVIEGSVLHTLNANITCSMWSVPELGSFSG